MTDSALQEARADNELIAEFMGWETRVHEHLGLLYSLPEYLTQPKRASWIIPSNF